MICKIKILKTKPWMIKFAVWSAKNLLDFPELHYYFIKEDDSDYTYSLFEYYKEDNYGHYKTKRLATKVGDFDLSKYMMQKPGRTYKEASEYDKEKILSELANDGFGIYIKMETEQIDYYKYEYKKMMCMERLKKLREETRKVETELQNLELDKPL